MRRDTQRPERAIWSAWNKAVQDARAPTGASARISVRSDGVCRRSELRLCLGACKADDEQTLRNGASRAAPAGSSCERRLTWLPAFGPIDVRRLAEEHLGRLHHRLAERRMRMDGELEIGRVRAHFDRQHAFGDELAGAGTDQADAEEAFRCRVDDQL